MTPRRSLSSSGPIRGYTPSDVAGTCTDVTAVASALLLMSSCIPEFPELECLSETDCAAAHRCLHNLCVASPDGSAPSDARVDVGASEIDDGGVGPRDAGPQDEGPRADATPMDALALDAGPQIIVQGGYARIPAGEFVMGCDEVTCELDEAPEHPVRITLAFWMKLTEVTHAEYEALARTRPSAFGSCGEDCPVEQVSWQDAARYANLLSGIRSRGALNASIGSCDSRQHEHEPRPR